MKKTALVIMAAGLGSRFGKGIKQLAKVGPAGEIIMEYSIHDALEAGFNKVVFIIRKDIEKEFKEIIGDKIEKITEVAYVYQDLKDLPEGFTCPEDRTKPWGTGQAVLAAKEAVQEPFLVINADDYYGKEAFGKIHDYLVEEKEEGEKMDICMAGFILANTLSDNGGVTRGVCTLSPDQKLLGVTETFNIQKTENGPAAVDREWTGCGRRRDRREDLSGRPDAGFYEYVGIPAGVYGCAGKTLRRLPERRGAGRSEKRISPSWSCRSDDQRKQSRGFCSEDS